MDLVRTATGAGVTTLTLDSPANRNALSTPLMRQLLDLLGEALVDPAVRAVSAEPTDWACPAAWGRRSVPAGSPGRSRLRHARAGTSLPPM